MNFVSSKAAYNGVARVSKSTTGLWTYRFFSTRTLPLLATTGISNTVIHYSSNNNRNSKDSNASSTGGNSADEDREELERERQLRERFATKVQQGIPNLNSNDYYQQQEQQSSFTGGWGGSPTSNNSMNGMPNMPMASNMFKL